ncbi:hypothetical protein [Paraburkholderia sp. 2C]
MGTNNNRETTMTRPTISSIAIGTVIKDFDEGPNNAKDAWKFYSTELDKHENPVAIVICNDQGAFFGEVWSQNDVPTSFENFENRMGILGVYEDDDYDEE